MSDSSHPEDDNQAAHGAKWLLPAIIAGVLLGGAFGAFVPEQAEGLEFIGDLFLNALKMLIVPLVVSSMISGIASLGDVRKLGKPGLMTVGLYGATTALAVLIGVIFVNVLKPGVGIAVEGSGQAPSTRKIVRTDDSFLVLAKEQDYYTEDGQPVRKLVARFKTEDDANEATKEGEKSLLGVITKVLRMMVSENIIESAAQTDILPLIFFALMFGGVLTTIGSKGKIVLDFFEGMSEAMMQMVNLIMYTAPIGIFALIAARLGRAGGGSAFITEVSKLGSYALCVILALLAHGILLGLIYWLLAKRNPIHFFKTMMKALTTAFSTASSSATLPLTMECSEEAGVSPEATAFVLPLGATVNMNGTALYESVAAIFIAQAFGIDLDFGGQLVVFVTATLAAIGAAGIPEAGLVTMLIVLNAAGLPTAGVGMLLSIDWFLDRCRTAINVWGDAVVGGVVDEMVFSKMDKTPVLPSD
jgi:solute carrier family 1 (neuronal/epithelial high affinity glutamate transporter), member 1